MNEQGYIPVTVQLTPHEMLILQNVLLHGLERFEEAHYDSPPLVLQADELIPYILDRIDLVLESINY